MAGHSKWAQIKRQKGSEDAKRSKLFARLSRMLATESRAAGGNVQSPSLRAAIERAKKENMPKDTIERAIEKGRGGGSDAYEPILYEGFGPGGAALLIDVVTDSRNRAAQEVKHALAEHGGALGGTNAAQWAFVKEGDGWMPLTPAVLAPEDIERLGALIEELEALDDVQNVYTNAAE